MRSETLDQLRLLFDYLPGRRRDLLQLSALAFVPAFIDLASVAVTARLAGSLMNNGLQDKLPGIHVFGGNNYNQSVWMIVVFIGLAWLGSVSKVSLKFLQQRLSAAVWRDLSDQLNRNLIAQRYEYHLSKNSAELNVQMLSYSKAVATNVVASCLQIVSSFVSVIVLAVGILFLARWLAVGLIISLIVAYALISSYIIPVLRHAQKQRMRMETECASVFGESLFAIRDIQLAGAEPYFESRFQRAGRQAQRYVVITDWLPDLPRAFIEPLGITVIFCVGALPALLIQSSSGIESIIPFIATIAIASLRLSPPLQDSFRAFTQLRGGIPYLSKLVSLLSLPLDRPTLRTHGVPSPSGLFPRRLISLEQAWYRYPSSEEWVLKGVSLTIPVGSRVAFVGGTGSGKTTTANLLLGLLTPQRGSLNLDGIPVEGLDMPAWQASCAHVPQMINLLNGSVIENVAFGECPHSVEADRIWQALEAAQIQEFVADLPYGLHTQIGENGVRLSGGQRQRLSLARAFYRKAEFLLLDEATSALDNRTESDVIQALDVVGRRCTTVVIAHRLSTVQRCDRIYEFADGRVKAYGSYGELQQRSDSFRELTRLEDRSASA